MKFSLSNLCLITGLISIEATASDRWYAAGQVEKGKHLFRQTCATCHGQNAEGTTLWKQKDENGNYPPPPLNGSAHAWHHSLDQLSRSIKNGGIEFGGTMPGFEAQYSDPEILSLIAFFQSRWPDEVYQVWYQNHMQ